MGDVSGILRTMGFGIESFDYTSIINEKQELMIDIAIELSSSLWKQNKLDKFDLISLIDNTIDTFIFDLLAEYKRNPDVQRSEFIYGWYEKRLS